jgi:hypothetical protein
VHHDVEHAAEMAERQRVSSYDLYNEGIVHVVVAERPAAHLDPQTFARAIARTCADQVRELVAERATAEAADWRLRTAPVAEDRRRVQRRPADRRAQRLLTGLPVVGPVGEKSPPEIT